jgi:hypothetical protein
LPFHCSTKVLLPAPPTATHDVVELQLTDCKLDDPVTVGPGITVHAEPFHCSMSGEGPAPFCPTATQKDALTQESPKRRP